MIEDGLVFFGNFDLASLSIWLFWGFFALLIYYLQTENMREGYPLENDDGTEASNQGPFAVPTPKTFKLSHGRGEKTVPDMQPENRTLALEQSEAANGFPFDPTGDPWKDGVGPASWAPRQDVPELDGHGHAKIVPMGRTDGFHVSAGRDPRGMTVYGGDGQAGGTISDMWIDAAEAMVRYLEVEVSDGSKRLVPITLSRIKSDRVVVRSIFGAHFADIPTIKSQSQVTLLEEDKIAAFIGGGTMYASEKRAEPLLC